MGKKRLSQLEFISQARQVHPAYDYSKSIYVNTDSKIIVTCSIHGDFFITPYHLIHRKQGCPQCSKTKKITQSEFNNKVSKLFPDYDFSKCIYINSKTKVEVLCRKHGSFFVIPESLFKGHGCPTCAGNKKISKKEFIERVKKLHPEFDYSKTVYENYRKKLEVICLTHGSFQISPHDLLQGQGCPKCAGKNFTQEEMIEKFISFHPEYSYQKTVYVRTHEKVVITCNKHGDFLITPHNFFQGQRCPKCGIEKRAKSQSLGTEEFIRRAKLMHPEYDYNEVKYLNNLTKVKIYCKKHGLFYITPGSFLAGSICAKCANENSAEKQKMSKEKFISRVKCIFPNYDYSKVNYVNNHTKVTVICPSHGEIQLIPANMLLGMGCRRCGIERAANSQRLTLNEFIERAVKMHPDYDYSKVHYINSDTKVSVICKKHGEFQIIPYSLLKGSGCPVCNDSLGETLIRSWLEDHGFHLNSDNSEKIFYRQKTFSDLIDIRELSYDFFIPSKNLLIEFNGEQHYHPVEIFQRKGENSFKKQKYHDSLKYEYAKNNNFCLLIIPYTDIDRINEILENELIV